MKRSGQVVAPLLAAAALAVTTGCRRPEMQRCVDEQNHVVPESFCRANGIAPQYSNGSGGSIGYFPVYRYYYGGTGGWNTGSTVSGGSYTSVSGHAYTSSSAVSHSESVGGHVTSGSSSSTSRGGFGTTHGGDAGGHGGASS